MEVCDYTFITAIQQFMQVNLFKNKRSEFRICLKQGIILRRKTLFYKFIASLDWG